MPLVCSTSLDYVFLLGVDEPFFSVSRGRGSPRCSASLFRPFSWDDEHWWEISSRYDLASSQQLFSPSHALCWQRGRETNGIEIKLRHTSCFVNTLSSLRQSSRNKHKKITANKLPANADSIDFLWHSVLVYFSVLLIVLWCSLSSVFLLLFMQLYLFVCFKWQCLVSPRSPGPVQVDFLFYSSLICGTCILLSLLQF